MATEQSRPEGEYVIEINRETTVEEIQNALEKIDGKTEVKSFKLKIPHKGQIQIPIQTNIVEIEQKEEIIGDEEDEIEETEQKETVEEEKEEEDISDKSDITEEEEHAEENEIEEDTDDQEDEEEIDDETEEIINKLNEENESESNAENSGNDESEHQPTSAPKEGLSTTYNSISDEDQTENEIEESEESGPEDFTEEEPEDLPKPNSDAFYVLCVLESKNDWVLTEEIKENIPDEWDVTISSIGTTLWHITESDWAENRKYEQDKRKKEFKITEEGIEVVKKVIKGQDDEQNIREKIPA